MKSYTFKSIFGKFAKYIVPMFIGGGLVYLLYSSFDFQQMKDIMQNSINYWWIALALIISILSHIVRAARWNLQLKALNIKPHFSAVVNSIFGTYAVNLVFPRLGEVWRSTYIADRQRASLTTVIGSMVGDRLSDTITVLSLTIATFFIASDAFFSFLDTYPNIQQGIFNMISSAWVWCAAVFAIVALILLFRSKSQNKFVLAVKTIIKNLWDGFSVIIKMKGKWWFLFYTILLWGCYYMQLYVATFAFPYTEHLGAKATLVLFVLSSISMGIPTNGGLGAWHIAIIFGLSLYGIGSHFSPAGPFDAQASAFAMIVWGSQTILLILLGIYAFSYIAFDKHRIASGKIKIDATNSSSGMKL